MVNRAWGNEYRTTMVCIDAYHGGEFSGRFYNPYLGTGQEFENLMQFLQEIDQTLDVMDFPKSFTATRTFAPAPKPRAGVARMEEQTGKIATFALRILFRQNASWQGSITWQEGGMEQSFRSALELIFLMDNALRQTTEEYQNGDNGVPHYHALELEHDKT